MDAASWTILIAVSSAVVGFLTFWLSYRKQNRSDLEADYTRRTIEWERCLAENVALHAQVASLDRDSQQLTDEVAGLRARNVKLESEVVGQRAETEHRDAHIATLAGQVKGLAQELILNQRTIKELGAEIRRLKHRL